ncbi:MAG: hypothetical protein AABX99_00885, partial [Nanoarchaeota archaeon]
MVNVFKKIICLIAIIFFLNFISASFTNGNLNHSIDKIYAPSGVITGWVNISLNNEPTNAIFKSSVESLEKKISLIDLISKNSNSEFSYTCSPLDCSSDYSAIGTGELSKSVVLNAGESSIFGFKITSTKFLGKFFLPCLKLFSFFFLSLPFGLENGYNPQSNLYWKWFCHFI